MPENNREEGFMSQEHTHIQDDGTAITHTHGREAAHTHEHSDGIAHTHEHSDGTVHMHEHSDGTVHMHEHSDGTAHAHGSGGYVHTHSHQHTKAVLNRLSRAIGHMESIKRMVEEGRDCSEVLVQLSAVKAAINNTGKIILEDHIEPCIVDAVEHGDRQAIIELNKAIDRFVK